MLIPRESWRKVGGALQNHSSLLGASLGWVQLPWYHDFVEDEISVYHNNK